MSRDFDSSAVRDEDVTFPLLGEVSIVSFQEWCHVLACASLAAAVIGEHVTFSPTTSIPPNNNGAVAVRCDFVQKHDNSQYGSLNVNGRLGTAIVYDRSDSSFASEFSLSRVLAEQGLSTYKLPEDALDWMHWKHREVAHFHLVASHPASLASSVFALVNGAVGATTLTVPFVMSNMGWALGTLTIVIVGVLSAITSIMLVRVSALKNCRSYDAVIKTVLGNRWLRVYQLLMVASSIGTLIAILLLCGDFGQAISTELSFPYSTKPAPRVLCVVLIGVTTALPLALLPHISSLRFTSLLSVVFIAELMAALMYKDVTATPTIAPSVHAVHSTLLEYFSGLSVLVLAFSSQTSVLPIVHEMKRGNMRTVTKLCVYNGVFVTAVYVVIGLVGYFLFGDYTPGNIMKGFTDKGDVVVIITLFCYLTKMVFTYPLLNFPFRVTLHYLLYGETEPTLTQHFLETVIPFLIACSVACVVTNVAAVFGLVGAVARTAVSFLFPAALVLRTDTLAPLPMRYRVGCWALFVIGVVIMAFGCVSSVYSLV